MIDPQSKYLLYGLGKSGLAALRLLRAAGVPDGQIAVLDDNKESSNIDGITFYKSLPSNGIFDVWVVSPGVPLAKPEIKAARASGIRIESEITLSLPYLKGEKVIGITGSMGKSTTSALIDHGIRSAGRKSFLGGNFGTPLADYAADILTKQQDRADFLVLELSSYQIENLGALELDIAVLVSLAPNHLERYDSLEDYYTVKLGLLKRCRKAFVWGTLSDDLKHRMTDPAVLSRYSLPKGLELIPSDRRGIPSPKDVQRKPRIPGIHNLDNIRIAAQVLLQLGLSEGIDALYDFSGLAHRLEFVGSFQGIDCYNDSKATSISSVHRAIETLLEDSRNLRLHCLVGGRDKKLPWQELTHFRGKDQVHFYFFGECGALARDASALDCPVYRKLLDAMEACSQNAKAGEIILLSPGGTSLDEFANFEKRGEYFKIKIRELLQSKT